MAEEFRDKAILHAMAANEVLVDRIEPLWMGYRLYYRIREDAYYTYDHMHGSAYFGKFRNDTDAAARWRGWLRANGVIA